MSKQSIIKKKILDLVKIHIKERDNFTCQHCHKENLEAHNCQGSHVYPDGQSERLSYNPLNLKTLCYHCHNWWHENPTESGIWFKENFPKRWTYIEGEKLKPLVHLKMWQYEEMYELVKTGQWEKYQNYLEFNI